MSVQTDFRGKLAIGQVGESLIAKWLRSRGWSVLPVYEKEIDNGKGPRLFLSSLYDEGELIAPDILAMREQKIQWVEAKHKTHFTWHRKSGGNWQTGVDVRHYLDYIKVQEKTSFPVWLMFLHRCNTPSPSDLSNGSPMACPIGLFGGPIDYLMKNEDHRDKYESGYRSYPMVYWNKDTLKKIATLEEVLNIAKCPSVA